MNEHYHFYYIKDYLGNVRETYKIPNAGTKECVQRMQYYPSGLPWEYVYNSSAQPYKYNSKEFVEMHGLDEYDSKARWYYPAICRTTTMDPLAEKYYSTSPYAWCGNNSVRKVDISGAYSYDWATGEYKSSYGNHDVVSWETIVENNFIEPIPNDQIKPFALTLEFISGFGMKHRDFTENDTYTQEFIKDEDRLGEVYSKIAIQIFELGYKDGETKYSLGEKSEAERMHIYKTDYTTILSMGYRGGNLYSAILGSFAASWSLEGFNHNGDAIVKITASNSMTPNSALRNPKTGYTQEWNQSTGKLLNVIFPNGLFGTQIMRPTEQTITWTTTIKNPSK